MKDEACGNDRYHRQHDWRKRILGSRHCPGVYPKRIYPSTVTLPDYVDEGIMSFDAFRKLHGYEHKHFLKLQSDKHTINFITWKCDDCDFEIEVFRHHVKSVLMYYNSYLDAFVVKPYV